MSFDAKKHLISLKGKDYLEVKWRIVWFKTDHPNGGIDTEIVMTEPFLLVKATIMAADSEAGMDAIGEKISAQLNAVLIDTTPGGK